jgi:hypothetical protein
MSAEMLVKAREILNGERISTSEFIRLSIAHLVETGKPPFGIPDDQRGKAKRQGHLKKSLGATFFSWEGDMSSHKFETLRREILADSVSKDWDEAKKEWYWLYTYTVENVDAAGGVLGYGYGECLCTHTPIVDHCVLKNRINGKSAIVGNVCVKKFLGIDNSNLFAGIHRIRKDIEAAPNESLIRYAYLRGLLSSDDELNFLVNTKKKRVLAPARRKWRVDVNRRLLAHFDRLAQRGKEIAAAAGETEAA